MPHSFQSKNIRYDRTKCSKATLFELFNTMNQVRVCTSSLNLLGASYVVYNRVCREDLVGREYVCYWGLSFEIELFWLDEVMLLGCDPRVTGPRLTSSGAVNVAPTSVLTQNEKMILKAQLRKHKLATHPDWANPTHVRPNEVDSTESVQEIEVVGLYLISMGIGDELDPNEPIEVTLEFKYMT